MYSVHSEAIRLTSSKEGTAIAVMARQAPKRRLVEISTRGDLVWSRCSGGSVYFVAAKSPAWSAIRSHFTFGLTRILGS